MKRSNGLATRALKMLAALAAVATSSVPMLPTSTSSAAADPLPYTVTVTPTTGVQDGQRLSVFVKQSDTFKIVATSAYLCRAGVTYERAASTPTTPPFITPKDPKVERGGPNCPAAAISSSADAGFVFSSPLPADGLTTGIRVGTGTVAWTTNDGVAQTLTCDDTHPCVLVVNLNYRENGVRGWLPVAVPLSYLPNDPLAGCNGPAQGVLSSGGSARITEAWVSWTIAACKRAGAAGAPTRGVFTGEGDSLRTYASGGSDLVYTGAGFDADVGLAPGAPKRASVAIPIGINAAVMGVAGGAVDPLTSLTTPYPDVRISHEDLTRLLTGQEEQAFTQSSDFNVRNPDIVPAFSSTQDLAVGASSGAEVTTWLGTDFARRYDQAEWYVPQSTLFGSAAGKPRGVTADFGTASPTFLNAIRLFTARSALREKATQLRGPGGAYIWTDLVTAKSASITAASIENGAGQYVTPTASALTAALGTMTKNADGLLKPDITVTQPAAGVALAGAAGLDGAAAATTPYPMTFVEYVLAPTEPLTDPDTGCRRTTSQAVMKDWLTYITTTGQADLPDGMVALTPELEAEAAAAIEQVGTAPKDDPCAQPTTTTTAPGVTTTVPPTVPDLVVPPLGSFGSDSGDFSSSSGGSGSFSSGSSGSGSSSGVGSSFSSGSGSGAGTGSNPSGGSGTPTTTTAGGPSEEAAVETIVAPGFAGNRMPSALLTLAAIAGVIALVSAAAFFTASSGSAAGSSAAGGSGVSPSTPEIGGADGWGGH